MLKAMPVLAKKQSTCGNSGDFIVNYLPYSKYCIFLYLPLSCPRKIANAERDFGDSANPTVRKRFKPDMTVLNEKIKHLLQERFLPEDAKARVDDLIDAMSLRGWDIESIGFSREDLEKSLIDRGSQETGAKRLESLPISPQQARKTARTRLNDRVNSAAKQLLNELGLTVSGVQLSLAFPGCGAKNNIAMAIILLNREVWGRCFATRRKPQLARGHES